MSLFRGRTMCRYFARNFMSRDRLPPGRLPAVDLTMTFRLLAVTLVPAPWQVLTPAIFAMEMIV